MITVARISKQTSAYDKSEVEKVPESFRDRRHFMDGGEGVSCFIWINGGIASSENSIRLPGLEDALCKVRGVRYTKINLD